MEGQLIPRGEHTWLIRVFVGRDANGKRRYVNRTVHGSKKDAQKVLREMLSERDKGQIQAVTKETVNQYLDRWLTTHRMAVKARTAQTNEQLLRLYIRPLLGEIRLTKLTSLDVQEAYSKLTQQGLSPSTVRRAHAALNGALNQAVKWRLIPVNPAGQGLVKLPKQNRKEQRALTAQEARRFLDVCPYDQYGTLFHFMLFTGVRPGEAFGLKWDDVDFEKGKVYIQRTLVRRGKGYSLSSPKTKKGIRNIPLSDELLKELAQLKARQEEEKLAFGPDYHDEGFVFASSNGQPLHDRNIDQAFQTPAPCGQH
ncbi:MAG: site-specific integrase [Alicyclobacillus macrosporangiidus]|uniref:site-specific integrase n=1 Tax=Alicyclobacillus macrosporangiidus TaxID=392015 RepID=UPI0026ECC271|nr:tyrosine-type recombinase/integrase [Alicyclobacillus macrosporangiidus]MCL6597631.1 site-specific integrase [Alicyclobacillus macrosporangiidus]